MLKNTDKRHQKRIDIIQELYSYSYGSLPLKKDVRSHIKDILNHKDRIDSYIKNTAPKYNIAKIAKVDLAILRLAIYELVVLKKEPPKVIINEAIELAKELAGSRSPSFVNAVLGKVYEKTKSSKK